MNYEAICGAIVDQFSEEAEKHASVMYGEIRARTTDVQKISENTGYSEEQIQNIKNYLFMDKHLLGNKIKRFDESFAIAQSWDRLTTGNYAFHDFLLLEHELLESELVKAGYSQKEAHDKVNPIANYGRASNEFYERLKKNNNVLKLIEEDKERYRYGRNERYCRSRR